MSLLEPLAVSALLGTRKQPLAALTLDGSLGALLQASAAASANDETRLLRAAAVLDACQQAGWVAPDAQAPAAGVAPEDTLALPPPQSHPLLAQAFADGYERLGQLTLLQLTTAQLRLPPHLLAGLLDKARRNEPMRRLLAPVLGERGRWLAERNPAWQVQAVDSTARLDVGIWDTGTLDQRSAWLEHLRLTDPAAARDSLDAARKQLDARERAALLGVLAIGLGRDDEPLLESFRSDRSKEVRRVAVDLLTRLPDSAYRQRMAARLAQCVILPTPEAAPGGLKGLFKRLTQTASNETVVRIEPPETFFADGKDDQLEEAVPGGEKLGQRAWWLYQVVAGTPLQWWQEHADLSPADWIAVAGRSDWESALVRGWYQAVLREGDARWAAALLERLSAGGAQPGRSLLDSEPLIALLPVAERERYWLHIAANIYARSHMDLSSLLNQMTTAIPVHSQPSAGFCRQLLPHIRAWLGHSRSSYDYSLRQAMRDFATLLPLDTFAEARQGWPDDDKLNRHQIEAINDWHHTLTLREQLQPLLD